MIQAKDAGGPAAPSCDTFLAKMRSMGSRVRIALDIVSMKVFVRVLGHLFAWAVDPSGGILDSHLFFYDRYSDLAECHRLHGRTATAARLAAIARTYYQAAPEDDDEPAAAMAMPVPRPLIRTNAVSTTRVPKPRTDKSMADGTSNRGGRKARREPLFC